MSQSHPDRMSDLSFRVMSLVMAIVDFFFPYIDRRVQGFGIEEGMTLVDYGCGPGRYTQRFAKLVGEMGKVYAVDIHELAIEAVKRKIEKRGWINVIPVLARGYDSGIRDQTADIVCAIDMFFSVEDPSALLSELKRISKEDGLLVIDDGHQSRKTTKEKLFASGHWSILEESKDHLKCKPIC